MEKRGQEMGFDKETAKSDEEEQPEQIDWPILTPIKMIGDEDYEVLQSDEVRLLNQCYREKFGECFVDFEDSDFYTMRNQRAAEAYRDVLRAAVERDEPTRIVHPS